MNERQFTFLFESHGLVRLEEAFEFRYEDSDGLSGIVACSNIEPQGQHKGIRFQVTVQAEDFTLAGKSGGNAAEAILTALTLATMGSASEAELILAYDATPNKEEHQFIQTFDVPEAGRSVKLGHVDATLELLGKIQGIEDVGHRERLIRAAMSLRRGLDISDSLSRFNEYWIGLECLNPLLEERVPVEASTWNCTCGKSYKRDEARGVKAFMDAVYDHETHKAIRKLRRDVFHGISSLPSVQERAADIANVVEEALRRAVLFCLGEELATVKANKATSLYGFAKHVLRVRATLLGSDPSKLGRNGNHPYVELLSERIGSEKQGDMTREMLRHTIRPFVNCPIRYDGLDASVPRGGTFEPTAVIMKDPDGTEEHVEFEVEPLSAVNAREPEEGSK